MPTDAPKPASKPPPREQSVPSTPFARVLGFGGLAARLAVSTAFEAVRRQVTREEKPHTTLLSEQGAERVAETLCKMRGAALKLGQMLSLQDEGLLPEPLAKALERVRQGADMMPKHQLYAQLGKELGEDWRERLAEFDDTPVAAASIGQVGGSVGGRMGGVCGSLSTSTTYLISPNHQLKLQFSPFVPCVCMCQS
jgi:aarF domain-containing kinase